MNKLVYSVFKAIFVAVIGVFVFDMVFYLYRAFSINTRMENITTSMRKVVIENNYMPEETAQVYQQVIGQMVSDYNHAKYSVSNGNITFTDSNPNDNFVKGIQWNYGTEAHVNNNELLGLQSEVFSFGTGNGWTTGQRRIVELDMSKPREYGDIQTIQLRVQVYQPLWGWGSDTSGNGIDPNYRYNGQDAQYWNVNRLGRSIEFSYTYYVPCTKYKSTNTI